MNDTPDLRMTECDREPIHIPGSIQPHGVLLALLGEELAITHASESLAAHLQRDVQSVLGRRLDSVLDAASTENVRLALAHPEPRDMNPLQLVSNNTLFDGIVHRHNGLAILELEDGEPGQENGGTLRLALAELQRAETVASLSQAVVNVVRSVTGFERVMLYRFSEEGHGSVDAEAKEDSLTPYLGLHYPASDIPQQARALYLRNWLRIIPDARYIPSPIVPAPTAESPHSVDLSFSVLRSVSPVHLEYLKNMGVRGSMSVSLIVNGELWGLISCLNHSSPRFVKYSVRSSCEAIGRLVSLQLSALNERERANLRQGRHATRESLAEAMKGARDEEDVLDTLMGRSEELLALVGAHGAAVTNDGDFRTCGVTPHRATLAKLIEWLGDRGERVPFATDSLSLYVPVPVEGDGLTSGVLTFALPGLPRRRVMWFRPEMVHTVSWAGEPQKVVRSGAHPQLHPRNSFEQWKEEVRLRSAPWTSSDIEAAEELRRRAVEIDLARQLVRSQQAVRSRDDLVAVVSHDLRNPLHVVQMHTSVILSSSLQTEGATGRRLRASGEKIQRAIDAMNALITDLLDLGKIEAGRFELHRMAEDVREVIGEALAMMRPIADAKGIGLFDEPAESCVACIDRGRMFQVLSNLIGNAIKFTPEGGTVTLRSEVREDELWITVSDTGPGIDEDMVEHIFERYWQPQRARRSGGSGLGLFIAKGIVEAHGGRIWADRATSGGALLTLMVPLGDTTDLDEGAR